MKYFKNFPVKELFLRVLYITLVFSLFVVASNMIAKKTYTQKHCSKQAKDNVEKSEKKVIALVEKLNAYIDEQSFLLTQTDKDKAKFLVLIQTIKERLDIVEQKAEKHDISDLIDQPQINEIRKNMQAYNQTFSK